ncbi:MAG: uracil-DNA glycosylase family protein [Cognaticolwellia sp.]
MPDIFIQLLSEAKQCRLCQDTLPLGAKPILQISPSAKILIAGQAPGLKVHQSGKPFDDKSGERLRAWLGVDADTFYNDKIFAILPMGFCYPGKGKSGDLAPRSECAVTWRDKLLTQLPNLELILAIGSYAQRWHLPDRKTTSLTENVKNWQQYVQQNHPAIMPLPHPSPRNNIWLKKHPWFEQQVIPHLQQQVQTTLREV